MKTQDDNGIEWSDTAVLVPAYGSLSVHFLFDGAIAIRSDQEPENQRVIRWLPDVKRWIVQSVTQ